MPAATIAVVVEPETARGPSRRRGTRGRRRRRRRARRRRRLDTTRAWRSRRFSGWIGSAGWFGNVPSSSPYSTSSSNGQALEDRGHDEAAHAVGGVGDDLERAQRVEVDEGAHVVGEVAEQVACGDDPAGRPSGPSPVEHGRRRSALMSARPVSSPTGPRPGQAQLDAVVLRRVVRRGEHRARRVELPGGEVDEVGGASPRSTTSTPWRRHALGEGGGQLDPRGPHVAADEDPCRRPGEAGEGRAEGAGDGGVELVGHRAPDVVGLEDLSSDMRGGSVEQA